MNIPEAKTFLESKDIDMQDSYENGEWSFLLSFGSSHTQNIYINLSKYGLNYFEISAQSFAAIGMGVRGAICEATIINTDPYVFQIRGLIPVVLGFAKKIIRVK